MLKSARVDKETGIKYKRIVKYFPSEKKEDIINALSSDPQKFNWSEKDDSEGVMVDIYYNLKVNKVYVHCFKYIPYEYCSCSDYSHDCNAGNHESGRHHNITRTACS